MRYYNSYEIDQMNRAIWGYNDFYYNKAYSATDQPQYNNLRDTVIESIERQMIPSIDRTSLKIPGTNGIKFTGVTLGATEINMRVTVFNYPTKTDVLQHYRKILFKAFYFNTKRFWGYQREQGELVEVNFPDTGRKEWVALQDIELLKVSRDGKATFLIKFINPTGFSHINVNTELQEGQRFPGFSVVPAKPKISFHFKDKTQNVSISQQETRGGFYMDPPEKISPGLYGNFIEIDTENEIIMLDHGDITNKFPDFDFSSLYITEPTSFDAYNVEFPIYVQCTVYDL